MRIKSIAAALLMAASAALSAAQFPESISITNGEGRKKELS